MAQQAELDLSTGIQAFFAHVGGRLLIAVREAVRDVKRIQLAEEIGIPESHLSAALTENERQRTRGFRMEWMGPVLHHDKRNVVIATMAELKGLRVSARPALDNARFRKRAEKVFREAGPLGEALRKQIEVMVDEEDEP